MNESVTEDMSRAVALVDRLLDVEERLHGLVRENSKLQRDLSSGLAQRSAAGGAFDPPRTTHDWRLADDSSLEPDELDLYDRRGDDDVVIAGRDGAEFFGQFNLLGAEPDFAGAVAAVQAAALHRPTVLGQRRKPDVSIVIPAYGQLAYTLNCIHSLITHDTRHVMEIIVIDDASPDRSGEFLPQLRCIRYHRVKANGGFIQSCNVGGKIATGRFLVLLNNDTRVSKGWLDGLIGSFERWPNAGLVGSKMHYADGSLQEAGGIVWRNGSAWNYGRNDDPNRPQYSHARQVDYVSGCSVALPTRVWRALGGFDSYFRPAYCEDVDLAFRVRARGLDVWFQPDSRIVHYEGKTSGTSTASGVKSYQIINTKKLHLRWRERLTSHGRVGDAPYFERERLVRKRILVIDATTPTPDQDAGSVQTVMALRICIALGYKAYFVPADNWLYQPGYTSDLQAMGVECGYAPYELGFENYIQRYGWLFDVVLGYRVGIVEKVLPLLRRHAPQAPVMFHLADLHYLRMEREARLSGDIELAHAATLMKQRELSVINQADCTISHSSVEREILATEAPEARSMVWPLMFEHFGTKTAFSRRRDLCFLGGYMHSPNVDAVTFFVKSIFPLIKRQEPDIRFLIAGAHPSEEVRALAAPDVLVCGQIADLRTLFDACRVFVCPLRVGAGAKGKVVAAMSYGIPVVSTPIGVEGMEIIPDKHVLIADEPEAFARSVLRLYRNTTLWGRLSKSGQELVRHRYSMAVGEKALTGAIESAFEHRLGVDASLPPDAGRSVRPTDRTLNRRRRSRKRDA